VIYDRAGEIALQEHVRDIEALINTTYRTRCDMGIPLT
jgi:hypothetical protein